MKRPARAIQIGLLAITILSVSACTPKEDDECLIEDRAGRPDLTRSPVFAASSVTAGNTIDVEVSVDGDTAGGTVSLLPVNSQDIAGDSAGDTPFVATPGGIETVVVTITVDGAATAGNYYPAVVLCDDAMCTSGTGYIADLTGFLADGNYLKANADGGNVDLGSLANSCVPQPEVAVN